MYVDIVISNAFNLNNFFFLQLLGVNFMKRVSVTILSVCHPKYAVRFIKIASSMGKNLTKITGL